ncbi:MAG: T9SS type A sorting domain-containing protein [Flavobacteriales bacterium]|nr:T9SS type A sorting domain-containing protein [Flavobacteriales bacterium]
MKNFIRFTLLILISLLTQAARSQDLVSVRVYFDNTTGGYQYFTLPGVQSIDQPFEVDVSGQTAGLHLLYVEVMDDQGIWSLYDKALVHLIGGMNMATLNAVEYFFDDDPGFGEGIQIAISGEQLDASFDLNLTGLSNGIHVLYIRVRDGDNQWSLYDKKIIHVVGSSMQELVDAEFFFNDDPGFGNGNTIDLSDLAGDTDYQLPVGNLSTGVHALYFRVKDAKGIWSLYDKEIIVITNPVGPNDLVQAEYYFDTDPGQGLATPLIIPQQAIVDGDFQIDIPGNLTGTHTVCIRVKNGEGLWSAVSCQTFTICNIAIPEITVEGSDCQSEPYLLAVPSGVYDSIVWSTDQTSSIIEVTEPGEYTVTVTDNGCSSIQNVFVDFQLMPDPEILVSGPVCIDSTQVLEVIGDFDNIIWPDGSGDTYFEVQTSGDYTVQVINGTCTKFATATVSFYQPENPEIITSGDGCEGGVQTLSVDASLTGIVWSNDESGAEINVTEAGIYSVYAYNQGCAVEASINVTFDTMPDYTIIATGGNCEGNDVTLAILPDDYNYVWFNQTTSSSVMVNQSGTYGVNVINGSCVSTDNYVLELISLPTPGITANANTLACNLSGYNYQWYLNGNLIDGATSQFYQATQSGFYTVEIESDGCTSESDFYNHTYIGVADYVYDDINMYPNPTHGFVFISMNHEIQSFELHDISGRIIMSGQVNAQQMTLDLSTFAAGTYVMKMVTPEHTAFSTIVKE